MNRFYDLFQWCIFLQITIGAGTKGLEYPVAISIYRKDDDRNVRKFLFYKRYSSYPCDTGQTDIGKHYIQLFDVFCLFKKIGYRSGSNKAIQFLLPGQKFSEIISHHLI